MKRLIYVLKISLIFLNSIYAQQTEEKPKFGISFSGFVKNDIFYDTRQTVTVREGHFLLYPHNVKEDKNGSDINAH